MGRERPTCRLLVGAAWKTSQKTARSRQWQYGAIASVAQSLRRLRVDVVAPATTQRPCNPTQNHQKPIDENEPPSLKALRDTTVPPYHSSDTLNRIDYPSPALVWLARLGDTPIRELLVAVLSNANRNSHHTNNPIRTRTCGRRCDSTIGTPIPPADRFDQLPRQLDSDLLALQATSHGGAKISSGSRDRGYGAAG
jgi:hypothetical protein